MSDVPLTSDWWQASDGLWYAPELHPAWRPVDTPPPSPEPSAAALPPIPGPSGPQLPPLPPPSSVAPPTSASTAATFSPTGPEEPPNRLRWMVAAIAIALLAVVGVIVYLVGRDDPTATTAPSPTVPTSTTTLPHATSTSTTPPSTDDQTTVPAGPTDPDVTLVDPAAAAALLQAINSGGPARADGFSTPEYDSTLVQFGQAICLTADQLAATGGDSTSLIAQTLTTTRDQLAESSAVIWADSTQASDGYARVLYYGVKYLCPTHQAAADAAFPNLAGT